MASITITGSDASTNALTLSDHGVTETTRSEVVTWIIGRNSGVSSIANIFHDPNSTEVFNPLPGKMPGNSTNWQGTVNPNLSFPPGQNQVVESYTICWKDASGNSHCFDPQIRVNN
ncbi:MAG: hypothetical protein OER04_16450 [Cyclobacteriaceae bacterium]|nr:hypothetical protein [Cyclobacteriaceae bacterium]